MKRWRKKAKTGRHTFRFQGVKITAVPGDVVECFETSLGSCAAEYDCLGSISGAPEEIPAEKSVAEGKMLKLVHLGRGYWNIINPDNPDKPLNDKALRKTEAEAILGRMLDDLEKGCVAFDEEGSVLDTTALGDPAPIDDLDWDQLIPIMQAEEIEILDEYETENHLREAITNARG